MPTYDYECNACGHRFERFQSITAPRVRKCPRCGKMRVRRLPGTGAGILFRGSGFYATDYRSDSYSKDAAKDKPSPDGPKKGSGKSGEGKGTAGGEGGSGESGKKP